jgi:hypothetical protein
LRRATNASQYTLGRTFFQEAYIIADYERSIFSVHQALFPQDEKQNLQAINPVDDSTDSTSESSSSVSPSLNLGALVGGTVGGITLVVLSLVVFWRIRKLHKFKSGSQQAVQVLNELHEDGYIGMGELSTTGQSKSELPVTGTIYPELNGMIFTQGLQAEEVARELQSNGESVVYGLDGEHLNSKGSWYSLPESRRVVNRRKYLYYKL